MSHELTLVPVRNELQLPDKIAYHKDAAEKLADPSTLLIAQSILAEAYRHYPSGGFWQFMKAQQHPFMSDKAQISLGTVWVSMPYEDLLQYPGVSISGTTIEYEYQISKDYVVLDIRIYANIPGEEMDLLRALGNVSYSINTSVVCNAGS